MKRATAALAALLLTACGAADKAACGNVTGPGAVGVSVVVTDSLTTQRLGSARIITTFGGATDTVVVSSTSDYPLAIGDTPGLYTVQVRVDGYEPWTTSVDVEPQSACDVVLQEIDAKLQRAASPTDRAPR